MPSDSAQLVGHTYRRADIGEYPILYDIAGKAPDQTLRIILIGKRSDILYRCGFCKGWRPD